MKLAWDQMEDRRYSYGVDRGVLYLQDRSGVPWNGLVSFDESTTDTAEPIYFDGVKVGDRISYGDFQATLRAMTYPDEFMEYEGALVLPEGLTIDGQMPKMFGLCFRTMEGTAVDDEAGYKLHILYNLSAVPDSRSHATIGGQVNPQPFSWRITGMPIRGQGIAPTEHFIFDSIKMNSTLLALFEAFLYGTDNSNAELPDIEDFVRFASDWSPRLVSIQPSGVANLPMNDPGDVHESAHAGYYIFLPDTRLRETPTPGLFVVEE